MWKHYKYTNITAFASSKDVVKVQQEPYTTYNIHVHTVYIKFMYCVNNDTIYKVKVKYTVHSTAWLNGKHGKLTGKINFRKVNAETKSCFQLFDIISTAIDT